MRLNRLYLGFALAVSAAAAHPAGVVEAEVVGCAYMCAQTCPSFPNLWCAAYSCPQGAASCQVEWCADDAGAKGPVTIRCEEPT